MIGFLTGLWGRMQGWAAVAAALLVALGTANLAGRRQARREAALDQAQAALNRRDVRDAVDRDVARDPGAAERLRRDWSRD
ncbi:hypothetical protein HB662_02330 [Roseomonas frigidaquae]|uniref:Uncharacterized protein n=1 Tax=Falsiroseomonas frigidaquae TaxID=487318 RepID=A0ABX1EWF7_9PROT|nr:hypothetical protein [Falsiroseomonas frigidaquae]NKE43597.1 hypothetical protein [Falsiroseomonas frigidaquae]